jgi:hypothetical protein
MSGLYFLGPLYFVTLKFNNALEIMNMETGRNHYRDYIGYFQVALHSENTQENFSQHFEIIN